MRRYLFPVLCVLLISSQCKNKEPELKAPPQFDNQLTVEEISNGLMTPEILWKFGRLGSFTLSPDGSTLLFTVTEYALQTESRRTGLYKISIKGGEAMKVIEMEGSSPQWFNKGRSIAFVNDGKLYTAESDGSGLTVVKDLENFESYSISPDGNKIYFTRRVKLDNTANEKYNMPNAKVRIIDDLMYRHWNYWSDYSYSHIFVAAFNGTSISDVKDIMEGEKFESPQAPFFDEAEITWSPDGRYIAYTSKKLKGIDDAVSTNSDIFLYDLKTDKEINITAGNRGYDRYPAFSPDGTRIAYQSMERDGNESDLDRLFVYEISSKSRKWFSGGWDYDVEAISWADNQNIYFASAHMGTTQIFKTDGKNIVPLTKGVHDLGPINIKSGVMVAQTMSMSMAPEIASVDMSTGSIKQLTSINEAIYKSIRMGRVEERYIKTKDDKDLQMWVVYPPDFDPAKKYPALLYCKGGPQGPLGQSWSYRWNYQLMAAKGYIVIAPNRRGNSGFGQEWKEQISGDYGGLNIQDYLDATDSMAEEPFVDKEKLGAVGASYGGYSVFYLAGMHGGRFKAFISHCGIFNFISFYGSTEELWFPNKDIEGPYWNTPRSYKFSPHLMADNWDTPMLIITGANDFRIPYTQSLEAFQAAQLRGVPSKLLFFEDEYHFITRPQNSVIWNKEFFEWLDKYLK